MPAQALEPATPQDLLLNPAVEKLERLLIAEALRQTGGNKSKAARLLDISERSLWYKIKNFGLES